MGRPGVVCAAVIGGLVVIGGELSGPARGAVQSVGYSAYGDSSAPVTLEVFSDFECAACRGLWVETLEPILDDSAAKKRVQIRQYSALVPGHKFSREASRWAIAAGTLGQEQWRMVSAALYRQQEQWSDDGNVARVVARVLPEMEFRRVSELRHDPAIDSTIEAGMAEARRRKMASVPVMFLRAGEAGEGERVVGRLSAAALRVRVDALWRGATRR